MYKSERMNEEKKREDTKRVNQRERGKEEGQGQPRLTKR